MGERSQIAVQVLVVMLVLAAGVVGIVTTVGSEEPPVADRTIAPPDASLIAATMRTPGASPTATPTPSPTATFATLPPPTPTPTPVEMAPYSLNGRAYTNIVAAPGTVFVAPYDARVDVIVYQIIDGEFRTGTDVEGVPFYPYVFLYSEDRVLKLRPGALRTDTEILATDSDPAAAGSQVKAGDPLFRVIGGNPSSWHYRYDAGVRAQVVVSLTTGNELTDLDARPFIKTR